MNLYLVRHAEAVPVGGRILRDADRTLSPVGEAHAEQMGKVLAKIDPGIHIVATSPLVRAIHTGEIIGHEVSDRPIFHVTEHLAPGFREKTLLETLYALSGGGSIVAVGHQPDMSAFVSYLIADATSAAVAFPPGAVACLRIKQVSTHPEAQLLWHLTPDVVKSLHPEQKQRSS